MSSDSERLLDMRVSGQYYPAMPPRKAMPPRQVRPRPIPPRIADPKKFITPADKEAARTPESIGCLYGVIWVVIAVMVFMIGAVVSSGGSRFRGIGLLFILFCTFAVPSVITLVIWISYHTFALQKAVAQRLLAEEQQLRSEDIAGIESEKRAVSVISEKVETIYCEQKPNLATLHDLLRNTEDTLNRADNLFVERACTPFWDSIEYAVELLRQFDKRVSYINQSAKIYYANLDGREHTFPAFPLNSEGLPNPNALMNRLTECIALAHREDQFGLIFEQRRTTSAIVTGFRNTQEAITSLRNDLVNSLSDLQRSLDDGLTDISSNVRDGFADMAERHEQSASELRETLDRHAKDAPEPRSAEHEKFVEGALDNIQNKREPRSSETKEPLRPK